jgi:serine phosphatase RsbU (regulator of sigma subunit)
MHELNDASQDMGFGVAPWGPRFDASWFVVALAIFVILMRRTLADRRTQQRLAQELEAARQVQNLFVSRGRSAAEDLEISTAYLPDQDVGGDF